MPKIRFRNLTGGLRLNGDTSYQQPRDVLRRNRGVHPVADLVQVLGDVPVRFKDLKIGDHGEARCHNISGSGAGFRSARELRPKTPLEMWFDLPDDFGPMHLLGKVSWSRQEEGNWRVGVSFDRQRLVSLARILKIEQ